jgi:hypothetical protein
MDFTFESISLACILVAFECYVAGALCSFVVAWRCIRVGDVSFALWWLCLYPISVLPFLFGYNAKVAGRWNAAKPITLCSWFVLLAVLHCAAFFLVLVIHKTGAVK